ncbi:hypothetical protein TTHERM_00348770 (macronuclear) [Tetrahymena thermophila SB210]|uniref:RING-type domain-containing protein n=1 Tax=Tetrahymena thermophila (strain SB210) TaxID=312017 RepID=I7MLP0_TETTS|nr:hypothetical protein TTHERM_00348770 [Tetrahymena thermophila SB210]EAS02787.2 hypothetical protein TTHERM_00348770 [Tetrahymena thermophila SB210]|eukprot:XP_001023032.2 hypothetical protein TTHERM_00348770 [Tetrahymena thermophila SB210]
MSKNFDKKFTLPLIDYKPPKKDDSENYNFIKETRKSRTSFKDIPPPTEDQEDLRTQVMRLKKELEQRNQSVMALQRNFESLSTMFKTEKSETQRYKNEVQQLRDLNQNYLSKIKDIEGKLDDANGKLVKGQQDNEAANEKVSHMNKVQNELAKANKRIQELESLLEQRNSLNTDLNQQLRETNSQLQKILNQDKNFEKEKKQFQADLQTLKDQNQQLNIQKEESERQVKILEENLDKALNRINDLQDKSQDSEALKEELLDHDRKMKKEIQTLKQRESDLLIQLKKLENVHESQQTLLKMKSNNESSIKQETAQLKELNKELEEELSKLREERNNCKCFNYLNLINNYEEMKSKCQDEIILIAKFEVKNNQQVTKELRDNVQIMSSEIQNLRQRLSEYEGQSSQQIDQLKEMLEREKNMNQILNDEKLQIQSALSISEEQKNALNRKLEQELNSQNSELNKQAEQNQNLIKNLNEYEQKKNMLEKEKQNYFQMVQSKDNLIDNLQKEVNKNQEKLQEFVQNIQTLRSDNSQLMQKTKELEEQNSKLEQQIQLLSSQNKELKDKYSQLTSDQKSEQTQLSSMQNQIEELKQRMEQEILNSQALNKSHKELITMLQDKEADLKKIKYEYEEKISLLSKNEKELDGDLKSLKASYEKKIQELNNAIIQKDAFLNQSLEYQQQIEKLKEERDENSRQISKKDSLLFKQDLDIKTLTSKLAIAEKNLEELDPIKVKQQIQDLKDKEKLLRSSVAKIENAAQAAEAQFGCSYCGQTIKDAKTCAPCGHSFCDACFKGYTPHCQECRKPETELVFSNKILDSVIGNYNYIMLTLQSIKVI